MAPRRAGQLVGMSAMPDRTIAREIVIDAPAEVVWRTITEPSQIALWFADRVEIDLRPGGSGALFFEDKGSSQETVQPLIVQAVEPPHRFSFRWCHPHDDTPTPGNSVLVEFTVTSVEAERTRLRVEETGLETIDWTDEAKASYVDDSAAAAGGLLRPTGWELELLPTK